MSPQSTQTEYQQPNAPKNAPAASDSPASAPVELGAQLSPAQKFLQGLRAQRGDYLHPVRVELGPDVVFEAKIKTLSDSDIVEMQVLAESRPAQAGHQVLSTYYAALMVVGVMNADALDEERYFQSIDEAISWQDEPGISVATREVRRLLVEKNPALQLNVLFLPGELSPESDPDSTSRVNERYGAIREGSEFEDVETIRLGNSENDVWHIRHLSAGELEELNTFMVRDGDGVPQMAEKTVFEAFLGAALFYGLAKDESGGHFYPQSVEGWNLANNIAKETNPAVIAVNQSLFAGILLLNPSIWPERVAERAQAIELAYTLEDATIKADNGQAETEAAPPQLVEDEAARVVSA
jgi:hypothetical protein